MNNQTKNNISNPENNYQHRLQFYRNNLPIEFTGERLFCCASRGFPKMGETKSQKIPVNVKTVRAINPLILSNLGSLEEAVKALTTNTGLIGIGYTLTGIVGCIDLDHCIDGNGDLSKFAQDCIALAPGAYVEKSISGNGIHIWGRFILPSGHSGFRGQSNANAVECYLSKRYILITGNRLTESRTAHTDIQSLVDRLIQECRPEFLCSRQKKVGQPSYGKKITINEKDWPIVEGMFFSNWTQRVFEAPPEDPSKGDFILVKEALRCYACWPRKNIIPYIALLLYRYREKHGNDKQKALRADYVERTIRSALNSLDNHSQKSGKNWITSIGAEHV